MGDPTFFYDDEYGEPRDDGLYDKVLDNPGMADERALKAIRKGIKKGMSLENAVMMFGTDTLSEQFIFTGTIEGLDEEES